MKLEYPPGATPIDLDEIAGLIPSHLTRQGELNEFEETNILSASEWLFARRRGDPLDERFIRAVHRRMMADLLLMQLAGRRFDWGRGSLVPASELRARYIAALRSADGGDYRPLLRFLDCAHVDGAG